MVRTERNEPSEVKYPPALATDEVTKKRGWFFGLGGRVSKKGSQQPDSIKSQENVIFETQSKPQDNEILKKKKVSFLSWPGRAISYLYKKVENFFVGLYRWASPKSPPPDFREAEAPIPDETPAFDRAAVEKELAHILKELQKEKPNLALLGVRAEQVPIAPKGEREVNVGDVVLVEQEGRQIYAKVDEKKEDGQIGLNLGIGGRLLVPEALVSQPKEEIVDAHPITDPKMDPDLLAGEEPIDLKAGGERTLMAKKFLSALFPGNFRAGLLEHPEEKKGYLPLTGNVRDISQQRVASCGSSISREIILMDPQNSPKLRLHYDEMQKQLQAKQGKQNEPLSDLEILDFVNHYIRTNMFPMRGKGLEQKLEAFVEERRQTEGYPCITTKPGRNSYKVPLIPIDEFIADPGNPADGKPAVCRHHGMVAAAFMDLLTREPDERPHLRGVPQHMRDNINQGAHVWSTFMSQTGRRIHVDTLWNEVVEFSNPYGEARLRKLYGEKTVDGQIRRTDVAYKEALKERYSSIKNMQKLCVDRIAQNPQLFKNATINFLKQKEPGAFVLRPSTSSDEPNAYSLAYVAKDGQVKSDTLVLNQAGKIVLVNAKKEYDTFEQLKSSDEGIGLTQAYTKYDEIIREPDTNQKESRIAELKLLCAMPKDNNSFQLLTEQFLKARKEQGAFVMRSTSSIKDGFSLTYFDSPETKKVYIGVTPEGRLQLFDSDSNKKAEFSSVKDLKSYLRLGEAYKNEKDMNAVIKAYQEIEGMAMSISEDQLDAFLSSAKKALQDRNEAGAFMIRPSTSNPGVFSLIYFNGKKAESKYVLVSQTGQYQVSDKIAGGTPVIPGKGFSSFEELKKEGFKVPLTTLISDIQITPPKTAVEMLQSELQDVISDAETAKEYILKQKEGSYLIRKSSNPNQVVIYYKKGEKVKELRLVMDKSGSLSEAVKATQYGRVYNDYGTLKERLSLGTLHTTEMIRANEPEKFT